MSPKPLLEDESKQEYVKLLVAFTKLLVNDIFEVLEFITNALSELKDTFDIVPFPFILVKSLQIDPPE
jgi:hypothetical protein